MSDERKPVICPWCGGEMSTTGDFLDMESAIGCGGYAWYECDCGAETPHMLCYSDEMHEAAYAAATQRPPNRPLTREQVNALPNDDAVWIYETRGSDAWVHSASYVKAYGMLNSRDEYLIFARKPTPADIEAARKERND